jgi:hypothetical protein
LPISIARAGRASATAQATIDKTVSFVLCMFTSIDAEASD